MMLDDVTNRNSTLKVHQNVLKIYGICVQPSHPLGLVTEWLDLGPLKFLLQSKSGEIGKLQLIQIIRDISRGIKVCSIFRSIDPEAFALGRGDSRSTVRPQRPRQRNEERLGMQNIRFWNDKVHTRTESDQRSK